MPNIVYVLANPAMPGIAKIGMPDRTDVQRRMSELYSTGVPLPVGASSRGRLRTEWQQNRECAAHSL